MSKFTLVEQELAGIISDHIMDIPQLQQHCHRVALAHSQIRQDEFDTMMELQEERVVNLLATNEDSPPPAEPPRYKLYWAIYNTTMQRITLAAVASWYNPEIME